VTDELSGRLGEIVAQFAELDRELVLETLLEYAEAAPELPAGYASQPGRLERVHECQTPFFAAAELDGERVRLFFDAPRESPTTRGFAGILHAGLEGATADEVLSVPADLPVRLGLNDTLSPLRARGITAILGVVQRQVRAQMVAGTEAELAGRG